MTELKVVRSLQPPNAKPGDRAIEAAAARVADVPVTFFSLWNPETCPPELLPWLGWGLSIDVWDAAWSEQTKRDLIADAIPRQQRKGSVAAVEEVIDAFDVGLTLHEWFQHTTPLPPYTFEIRLPVEDSLTGAAAFIEKVADQVVRVKPARAHFTVAQTLTTASDLGVIGAGRAASAVRLDTLEAPRTHWTGVLLTEDGEPIFDGDLRLEIDP
ncbi:MAG: phage tail protein I [Caulobacteraceae bacterium]|nr:phage tail protein I [Caulobacteraceae bacterium]